MNTAPSLFRTGAYMAHHSRSFRFATLLLGSRSRVTVERVYAWCRHTDNIVDDAAGLPIPEIESRLDEWLAMSRAAYEQEAIDQPLVAQVMRDMRLGGASFSHAEAIVRGVRSDLRFRRFDTLAQLRIYTHDVASVVGLWLSNLHGVRDPWMLERAAALGHAMQLTNILRDVGEDLALGRLYLPLDVLARHGLTPHLLHEIKAGNEPIPVEYHALIEDLMALADANYRFADEAIPHLPADFAPGVAVASAVYRSIHDAIRANGYDNLSRRAATTRRRKLAAAGQALLVLKRAGRTSRAVSSSFHPAERIASQTGP